MIPTTCFFARGSPQHRYRIHGFAGTAHILDVQAMDGHFRAGPNHKSLGTLTDLRGDASGHIEVLLSADPQPGHWLQLPPTAAWIYVRQYFYDWDAERPADLLIQRIGATYPPPRIAAGELRACADRIIGWIPTWYRHRQGRAIGYDDSPLDALAFFQSSAGMDDRHHGRGKFDLAPDDAQILEFRSPQCRCWGFQPTNDSWETLPFDMHLSSLNGHRALRDADGVCRAVIALRDPAPPRVAMRKVKLQELRRHLPPTTPTISAAERGEQLLQRMRASARRPSR
ncbi:MAG: hypothetical protein NZM12_13790 [Steroidobacteraceae bacterium]|nr:hypothetical protein [Steroidobacteraceae bacterium]MDW8260794.1 hypothetical protein [Gammaproteobacteria bacterium]